jgi:hypothetical protein
LFRFTLSPLLFEPLLAAAIAAHAIMLRDAPLFAIARAA